MADASGEPAHLRRRWVLARLGEGLDESNLQWLGKVSWAALREEARLDEVASELPSQLQNKFLVER